MNKQQQRVFLAAILAGIIFAASSASANVHTARPGDFVVAGGPIAAFKTVDGRLDIIETDRTGAQALVKLGYRF